MTEFELLEIGQLDPPGVIRELLQLDLVVRWDVDPSRVSFSAPC